MSSSAAARFVVPPLAPLLFGLTALMLSGVTFGFELVVILDAVLATEPDDLEPDVRSPADLEPDEYELDE